MDMTINETRFILDGESSTKHGVMMVNAFGSSSKTGGSEIRTIITTQNPFKNVFDLHYVRYDEPLEFDFILAKTDHTLFDAYDERRIKKWICKNKYTWLQVDQPDLVGIMYRGIVTKVEALDVGGCTGSLKCTFQCDSPNAWTTLRSKTYTCNGDLNFKLNITTDFNEHIVYPQLAIKSLANGTVSIMNSTTNETVIFNNCTSGEEIFLDCNSDLVKSSTERVLIDQWNCRTLSIVDGNNNFTLTGNFTLEIKYRLPVRIGG